MAAAAEALRFRIGSCCLDLERGVLEQSGDIVPVRAKTFALLSKLARSAGHVVSKSELMDTIWPDTTVTEDSLTQAVKDARRVLRDEEQALLRTVPKRGYLLVCTPQDASAGAGGPALWSRPCAEPVVAVLPFEGPPEDARTGFLLDGLADEVTQALACFRSVTVLARNSAFAFPPEGRPDFVSLGARLGADYLVEGSAITAGATTHLRLRLVDTADGRQVWSHRYQFEGAEILEAQAAIASQIVARLIGTVEAASVERARQTPASDLPAYLHLQQGIALLRSYGPGVNEEGRSHILKATELDPKSGLALSYLALADVIIADYRRAPAEVLTAARDRAVRAVALSPTDHRTYRILGLILLFNREYAAAQAHLERALQLNPYDADTLVQFGYVLSVRGRADEGLVLIDRGFRLNPLHPDWYYFDKASALYTARRYRESAEFLARAPVQRVTYLARLAAASAMAGDLDGAAAYVRRLRALNPDFDPVASAKTVEYEHGSDVAHFVEGIEKALAAGSAT